MERPFCRKKLTKISKILTEGEKRNKVIKTWSRSSTIIPQFVGKICQNI